MKKKAYVLPLVLTPLLFSTDIVLAEEAAKPATTEVSPANSSVDNKTEADKPTTADDKIGADNKDAKDKAENTETTENKDVTETKEPEAKDKDIVILHTNDIHGRMEEDKRGKVIGVAKLDTVVKEEKAKTSQTTVVVDAGDALQGLPISNSTKGEEMVKIMNKIGYDAIAVGNHEFDFGFDQAVKYKELFQFPLLSANTYVNGVRLFEAATVVDKDKTVVGDEVVVIGVTTPETYTKTHPKNIKDVEFRDPITEVKNVIAEMESKARAEGKVFKNYVVIGHLGIDDTTKKEWQGSTLATELSQYALLANKKVVVIDGHSHTVHTATYGKNVAYNQTGNYLNNIGKVTIGADGKLTPELISYEQTANIVPSEAIANQVAAIKEKFAKENAVVILDNNPVELNGNRKNVRVRETNLGNLVADALYQYGQTGFSNKADLAVTNGGGLRETIKKDAPITKGDIIAVLPFGNTVSQIEVNGSQLQDMFKHSLSAVLQKNENGEPVLDERGMPLLEANGSFLHTSGVKVYHDTTVEPGDRILRIEILNKETGQYEALDVTKTYYLVTNDFLAAGGDGYTMLGGAREEGPSMDAVFAEYIKQVNLTDYADINPNQRIISLPKVEFEKLNASKSDDKTDKPTDTAKQSDAMKQPDKTNVSDTTTQGNSDDMGTDKPTNTIQKGSKTETQADKSDKKQLPKTGETTSAVGAGLGIVSVLLGFIVSKVTRKDNN